MAGAQHVCIIEAMREFNSQRFNHNSGIISALQAIPYLVSYLASYFSVWVDQVCILKRYHIMWAMWFIANYADPFLCHYIYVSLFLDYVEYPEVMASFGAQSNLLIRYVCLKDMISFFQIRCIANYTSSPFSSMQYHGKSFWVIHLTCTNVIC